MKEAAFLQEDRNFRVFLEAAPDAMVVVDDTGLIIVANQLVEKMFGYTRQEILGQPVETLVPERFRRTHIGHRAGYAAHPKTRPMGAGRALTGLHKNGSEFPIEISLSPLQTERGTVVISIIRDLTDRLRAETKFRGFLESAPDAVVVIDRAGKIVIVNSLTEKMFGYSRDELLGQSIELLVPERYRGAHVRHREGYGRDPITRPMGEGRALTGKKKDGSEFPVEISLSPLESDQGTLVTSIIRDIGPRRQLEAKFKGLLESAPDGIVVVDTDGRIAIVNSQTEKLFGYERNELIGQPIEILVPDRLKSGHVHFRNAYIAKPITRPMGAGRALTGKKKDGSEFPIEISLSPLETDQGTLVTSIIRDITARRAAEDQIQSSLREKEALLKEIHHRVKNNLQVTSSLLRLQSGYIADEKSREMFAESQNRIRSMALVHEKLYQSTDLSRINFPEYIKTLTELLIRTFGVNPEQIQLKVARQDVFLTVETAVPCGLMINELISNCLKHAFPNGRRGEIKVSIFETACKGDRHDYLLEVIDNGVGLPEDLDLETSETLGLQLVRNLTEQLRGTLKVIRPPEGVLFRIQFSQGKAGPET
jgi:PAS domain S-box-containing protein